MVDVVIAPVEPADAGEIFTLQRAAYVAEAQLYGDAAMPALVQSYDEVAAELTINLALKASIGHRIAGSVRARRKDTALHIGRLMVAPDLQGCGIGTLLLTAIERMASADMDRYLLFTGHRSHANIRLYERLGYAQIRRFSADQYEELVHFEKPIRDRGDAAS